MTNSVFVPNNKEPGKPPKPPPTTVGVADDSDEVHKAQNEQHIAEAKLKTRLAEEGIEKIEQLNNKVMEFQQQKADFEKQKALWLEQFETQKAQDIEKIKTLKAYWESKATPVREMENNLTARSNRLDAREQSVKAREQAVDSRLTNLDNTFKQKEQQIAELADIIQNKAPTYYRLFKKMLSEGERRMNWNYNTARGDQWHNFTARIGIVFNDLHRMMFGE